MVNRSYFCAVLTRLAFVAIALGCLSSCLREEGDLTILPNGAGRLDLEITFGKQHSDGIREEVEKGRKLVYECRRRVGRLLERNCFLD